MPFSKFPDPKVRKSTEMLSILSQGALGECLECDWKSEFCKGENGALEATLLARGHTTDTRHSTAVSATVVRMYGYREPSKREK